MYKRQPVYGDNINPDDLVVEGGVVDSEETVSYTHLEYSPFFRSHRMELLEYCPEMNCETVRICLSQELRCLPELRLKVAYL